MSAICAIDERAAQADRLKAGRSFAAVTQRVDRVDLGGAPGRIKPEDQTGNQGHDAGGKQNGKIQRDLVRARNPILRQASEQQVQTPTADEEPADSAKRDEHERLDQLLPRDCRPAGAEGEADRDFALASGGANELQAGHIRAGDEQDDKRRPDHEEQTFTEIADHLLMERTEDEVPTFVKFRITLREAAGDGGQLGLRAGNRHARFDPCDHTPEARIGHRVFVALRRKEPPQDRDVERVLERARHDPDDFMRDVGNRDELADDVRPAPVLFLPNVVAQDDDRLGVGYGVLGQKRAAHQGAFAEDAEVILRDQAAGHRGRLLDLGQVVVIVTAGGDGFEGSDLFLEFAKAGRRHRFARIILLQISRLHRENAIGVRIRQWRHENGVDHREDGGVRADAERKGEDRDEGEPRRFPELAKGVAEIVHRPEVRSHMFGQVGIGRIWGAHATRVPVAATRRNELDPEPQKVRNGSRHCQHASRVRFLNSVHSARSVIIGLTREARRAGIQQAKRAAAARTRVTVQ